MLLSLLLPVLPVGDQVLVSSFQPAAVSAYSLQDASFEGDVGPGSPLTGTLGTTLGPDGLLYVASEGSNQILRFDPGSQAFVDVFIEDDPATPQDETGGLSGPSGVVFGPDGRLYVGSFVSDSVLVYDGITGTFDAVFVEPNDGNLNGPDSGMAFGPDGLLYVPSFFNNRVKRYDASGDFVDNFLKPTPSGLTNPRAVYWPGDGTILATSEGSDQVLRFDAGTGDFLDVFIGDDIGTPGIDESGGLDGPTGIVRDVTGNYWIASVQTDEVKRYDAQGTFLDTPIAAGGAISAPVHLTVRPRSETVCATTPNSVGQGALLAVTGSASVAAGELGFELSQAPAGQLAVLARAGFAGPFAVGQGNLCLGSPIYRLGARTTDAAGRASWELIPGQTPGGPLLPGSAWDFQVGYRDTQGGPVLDFSSSVRVQFVP